MATSSVQSSQHAAEGDSGDDVMHAPDDSESEWGSVSDGLVGEEEMAGVEDLWMEHLQCVHTHGRHKYVRLFCMCSLHRAYCSAYTRMAATSMFHLCFMCPMHRVSEESRVQLCVCISDQGSTCTRYLCPGSVMFGDVGQVLWACGTEFCAAT